MLELIDPVSGTDTLNLTPGQSGSFEFVVTGLTASQPLDSFSLVVGIQTGGEEAPGFDVSGYTSLLPTGWNHGTLQYIAPFTGQNVSGSDITGTTILGTLNFTLTPDSPIGTSASFFYDTTGIFELPQFLQDSNGNDITYSAAPGIVHVVPEPSIYLILLLGISFLPFLRQTRTISTYAA